jgi:phosphoribosylformylglycinamidine synthase
MAIASIDEAVRNAVAVGANPDKLAILDNFCWPSVDDEQTMGTLVRACEACRDAALAYRIPFISGKDSLHNQFTNSETGEVIRIPRTLLISAIGVIDDVSKCITMDLKGGRDHVLAVARPRGTSLTELARAHRGMAALIARGEAFSCHDVSDGGLLVAAAEMCIASGLGVSIDAEQIGDHLFEETLGSYLIEIDVQGEGMIDKFLDHDGVELRVLGPISSVPPALEVGRTLPNRSRKVDAYVSIDDLTKAWRGTLDW